MDEPPEGYLGAGARIRRGPAPELVAAGSERELADAPLLARGLTLADLAHVDAHPAIPAADASTLRTALLELEHSLDVDPRYGDLVNARERDLQQRIGDAAGWLNAGRPRREAGRIAFRIAARGLLLDLGDALVRFAGALVELAARERDTLMPDYTYLQVAQPTSVGHWVLSFAYPALRDLERLETDLAWVNRSPAGAGGVNGSRFAIDRERLAELLGFDAPIVHTRDAMWQTDGLTEAAWHAATAATNASRFAEDLELYGSDEFGLLAIGDDLCRASALMPQKRNPYALVVIRGAAGTLLGRATGLLATQRTPSGRTDNLLYAYGELGGALALATRTLALAAATAESVVIDRAVAERSVKESFALAADVADTLSLEAGLDYRTAYNVVGRAVAGGALTPEALEAAAEALLRRPLGVDHARLRLDPAEVLASRTVTGGAAPAPMDAMLRDCRDTLKAAAERLQARRAAISSAEAALLRS
jgi:argininosuccinate lyase